MVNIGRMGNSNKIAYGVRYQRKIQICDNQDKILLLGSHDSGKSTFFHQTKSLSKNSEIQNSHFLDLYHFQVLKSVFLVSKRIIEDGKGNYLFNGIFNDFFLSGVIKGNRYDQKEYERIKDILKEPLFNEYLFKYKNELHLSDQIH